MQVFKTRWYLLSLGSWLDAGSAWNEPFSCLLFMWLSQNRAATQQDTSSPRSHNTRQMCELKGWQKSERAQLRDSTALKQQIELMKTKKINMYTSENHDFHFKSRLNVQSFSPTESELQHFIFLVWNVETFWLKINILIFPSQIVYMWFVNKMRSEMAEEEVFMWGFPCTAAFWWNSATVSE